MKFYEERILNTNKMNKSNPVGIGSFSLNRASGSSVGTNSVAMGENVIASGYGSHAEGSYTSATNSYSHAEGRDTISSGYGSHAEGVDCISKSAGSHAEGNGTVASWSGQHTEGTFNIIDTTGSYLHIAGNGTSTDNRSNAYTLDWVGNAWFLGDITTPGINLTSGQITREGISCNWWTGRDYALLRTTSVDGYSPAISIKTSNGSWEIGAYTALTDQLDFVFVSDTNYDSRTNTTDCIIKFGKDGILQLDGIICTACSVTNLTASNISTSTLYINSNAIVSGNLSCSSSSHISVGDTSYNDGYIELFSSTPYIDFHYGNSSADYTSRIIESSSGTLSCMANLSASGNIYSEGYLSCKGRIKSIKTYGTTGTAAANMVISSSYWTYRSSSSSKRYKHDIAPLSEKLNSEKLLNIPVHQYIYNLDYIDEADQRYNTEIPEFIAEEVHEAYPIAAEVVDGQIEDWNQRMMIPPMLDLIQKLWKRVDELEDEIKNN